MPSFTRTLFAAGLLAAAASAQPVANPFEHPRCQIPPGIVITQCRKPNTLALAYDDGPYTLTSELVDMLDAAGAKATFFWTGTLYGCIYDHVDAIRKAYASGHQVASHTWLVYLFFVSDDARRTERKKKRKKRKRNSHEW